MPWDKRAPLRAPNILLVFDALLAFGPRRQLGFKDAPAVLQHAHVLLVLKSGSGKNDAEAVAHTDVARSRAGRA